MLVPGQRRECQRTDYDSRSTWDRFSDTSSTLVYSMGGRAGNPVFIRVSSFLYFVGYRKVINLQRSFRACDVFLKENPRLMWRVRDMTCALCLENFTEDFI